ncbi:T9SS type A sorting domain-containing protein [uncultured Polaribacter sp.]|uniref:T9SS type A sorting domain-containing protein n=1 Tax=uncultured Polaribacter sp. TaxID=174711 RepID=UPI00259BDB2B|nr:T9SS type A sorting domain-containing protein [uncultured Polaribacter sp.]
MILNKKKLFKEIIYSYNKTALSILVLALLFPLFTFSQATFVGSNSNCINTNVNSITINIPSGNVNDLLIAAISSDERNTQTFNTPSGWTLIQSNIAPNTNASLAVYYRVADGSEGATQAFTVGLNDELCGAIIRYDDVDNLPNPIDVSALARANTGSANPPAITTNNNSSTVINIVAVDGTGSMSIPSGTTERVNNQSDAHRLGIADEQQSVAGSINPSTWGNSSQEWVAVTLAFGGVVVIDQCDPAASGNTDSDGDGVSDICDLDDDNDGVIDTDEYNGTTYGSQDLGGLLASTGTGTFDRKSGVVNNLTFTSSPVGQDGTYIYTDIKETEVGAGFIKATFFQDGQGTGGTSGTSLGVVDVDADRVSETTIADSYIASNYINMVDFDTDIFTFTIQTWSTTGLYTSPSDINFVVYDGTATLSAATDLGGGVFEYTLTGTLENNSKLRLSSASGELIQRFIFTGIAMPNRSGDRIQFDFQNNIETAIDTDKDGIADYLDLDSDNDGIPDVVESGGTDSDRDGRADGIVGALTTTYGIPSTATTGLSLVNSDSDAIPDYLDIDSDNDGIPDNIEAQTSLAYIPPSGIATSMNDANNNGVDDDYEISGNIGFDPVNTDLTDNPDYLDADSDNDGYDDISENRDTNNTLSNSDTDGDGLDNNFDDNNDSSINGFTVNDGLGTNHKVTDIANLETAFGDEDSDFNPGSGDVDFRDRLDTDRDSIDDVEDLDDDNDGILDVDECNGTISTEKLGGLLATTGSTFVQKSGVVNDLSFPSSPTPLNSTYTYTDIRETEVTSNSIKATFFRNNQVSSGGIGTLDVDAGSVSETTLINSYVASNYVEFIDIDADVFTFTLQVWSVSGLYTNSPDITLTKTGGSGTLSALTDLGGGVFQCTVSSASSGHNTKFTLSSTSGELIKRFVFTATDIPNTSGDRIQVDFINSISTCTDEDDDGTLNSLDTDSDNDGCPDALEGNGGFVYADLDTNGRIDNPVNDNGIPVLPGTAGAGTTGQSDVSSTNAAVQSAECDSCNPLSTQFVDTDLDGIGNRCDLDDDNDGVLDATECNGTLTNEKLGGLLASTGSTFDQKSGVVHNLSFPSSPISLNGTYSYTDVRETEVSSTWIKATFFRNNQISSGGLGTIDVDMGKVSETTLANSHVASNSIEFIDFDADIFTFTLQVWSVSGLYNVPTDINLVVSGGSGTLSAATDLGSGVFQYTISSVSSNHNTRFILSSASGELIKRMKFTATDIPNQSGDKIQVEFVNVVSTCSDTDGDAIADYKDLDSDGDGCPDVLETAVPALLTSADIVNGDGITNTSINTENAIINTALIPVGTNGYANILENADTSSATALNAFVASNYTTYATENNVNGCGVPMITQVYWKGTEKIIEVTNKEPAKIVVPYAVNVNFFNEGTTTSRTATTANTSEITAGSSILVSAGSITAQTNGATVLTSSDAIAFDNIDDIITISRSGKASDVVAYNSRIDQVSGLTDNTALVRKDEVLEANTTYTATEWVSFVDDDLNPYRDLDLGGPERHPHAPLLSEITSGVNAEANALLGLHNFGSTKRVGGVWDNGFPDRSRHVEINENYNHNLLQTKLEARKLSVNNNSKFAVTNNLLVVTDEVVLTNTSDQIRLVGNSQMIQTHTGDKQVSGNGKLLVDQNSTVSSLYRFNYFSSPVNNASGDTTFSVETILKDGTTPLDANSSIGTIAKDITFVSGYDGAATDPISLADYWIFTFKPSSGRVSNWVQKGKSGLISETDGFILKGPNKAQNYTFVGTPKDGDLDAPIDIGANQSYLIGNPYASSLSSKKFIEDNINSITGTLYFWQHVSEVDNSGSGIGGHNYSGYIGGYATRNIAMGLSANDPSKVGAYDVTLEAEDASISGTIASVQGASTVLINSLDDVIEFKNIIKGVDTLSINYSSTLSKKIIIKVNGIVQGNYTLPSSVALSTFDIVLCIEAGSDVVIESDDLNLAYINNIRLQDDDGKIGCSWSPVSSNADLIPKAYIPIGQGFFIQGDDVDGGPIVFNNSQREYKIEGSDSQFFKASKTNSKFEKEYKLPILKLGMDFLNENGISIHRRMGVSFNENNSFAFDKGYDSELYDLGLTDVFWKFPNNESKYIIAGVQDISDDLEVPFDIVMNYDGSVVIKIDDIEAIDREVFIKDKITEKTYLLNNKTVALQLNKGLHSNRFTLAFKGTVLSTSTNTNEILENNILVFTNTNDLIINNYSELEIDKIEVFNILGKKLNHWKINENLKSYKLRINKELSTGVYIVKINSDKGEINKKIILK